MSLQGADMSLPLWLVVLQSQKKFEEAFLWYQSLKGEDEAM